MRTLVKWFAGLNHIFGQGVGHIIGAGVVKVLDLVLVQNFSVLALVVLPIVPWLEE